MNNGLPRLLTPAIIKQEFFNGKDMPNLNLPAVYGLFQREDFPKIRIGRKLFVPTNLFLEWLEKEAQKNIA
jgi:hypothetical protein